MLQLKMHILYTLVVGVDAWMGYIRCGYMKLFNVLSLPSRGLDGALLTQGLY